MKKYFLLSLFILISFFTNNVAYTWGFFAHKRINRLAVFTLPKPMYKFYRSYIDYITEHAVDPDKRRYVMDEEAPRHYIDLDHYGSVDEVFDLVPQRWDSAVAKLSEDTLQAYGIVPWHVHLMKYKLQVAFEEHNLERILKYSADIGHYIADAHVPLHTSENYNGQMTNQVGIHGFWESRLPELFADEYDYLVAEPKYLNNTQEAIWEVVKQSHLALDSVLTFEKELTNQFLEDQKYAYEERGRAIIRQYSTEFSNAYHNKLDGMVERRMRSAIHCVASFWFTAWVDAGQPDLDKLINEEFEKEIKMKIELEKKTWKKGEWKGRPEE